MIGKCLCGAAEFEVDPPYPALYQCHCALRRKQGGFVSNTGMIVATDRFRWLAGELLITQWTRSSGFRSFFCSCCGAPVPNPLRDTGYIWASSGLREDGARLEIRAQLYVESRANWDVAPGPGKPFSTAPDLPELIRLLHESADSET